MGKKKGKRKSDNGSSNPQSINRGIEKRPNRHQISQVRPAPIIAQGHALAPPYPTEPPFPPAIHQLHAFAPPHPHGPPFPPAIPQPRAFAPSYPGAAPFPPVPRHASGSSALLQGEDLGWGDELSGYIFMCNGNTKSDCYKYRVLGLPASRIGVAEKIKPRMKLFLFDFDVKLLYGIYVAASNGVMALEPTAFGGRFPAQVRFEIFKDCLPLPESAFKHVIKYQGGSKFKQELSGKQVADLISLFRPIDVSFPTHAAAPPRRIEHAKVEAWARPAVELSASYDQYLAGIHTAQRGQERCHDHFQQTSTPFSHVPDVSTARIPPIHLQPVVSQLMSELYYAAAAQQAYHPEMPSLAPLEIHSRYAALPRDDEGLRGLREHAIAPSQGSNSLPSGHAHIPKPTLSAAYWTGIASGDPSREYSGHYQWQEPASSGSRAENVPDSATVAGSTTYPSSVLGNNAHYAHDVNHPQANTVAAAAASEYYNPNVAVSANYAPVQHTHDQMAAYQPVGPAYEAGAYLSSSSQTAAYQPVGPAYEAGAYLSSLSQTAAYQPVGPAYEAGAYLPSSSQTAAYWTGVANQDPNHQVTASGDTGTGGEF